MLDDSSYRLLGVLQNWDITQKGVSATGNLLNVAMRQLGHRDIVDVSVGGWERRWRILRNFSPDMETWRFKFHLDTEMRRLRSKRARHLIESLDFDPDVVLQIGSEFDLSGIPRLRNRPRFSYHDSNLHAYLQGAWSLPEAPRAVKRALEYETAVYRGLDGVLTMSEYLRKIFIEDFGVDEEKVHNIGVGYNFSDIPDVDKEYDGKTILFLARHLFEQKGGKVILEAWPRIRSEIPGARLVIVGQDLEIDLDGVECIGFIDKRTAEGEERLLKLFRESSVFAMPTYYDAFGVVFLEAMANRLPCIGARCCAMPEIIESNGAGLLIEPGNARQFADHAIALLSDETGMREMGANGLRAIKEKYTWPVVGRAVDEIVRRHLG